MNIEGLGESLLDQLVDAGTGARLRRHLRAGRRAARGTGRRAERAALREGAAAQARQGRPQRHRSRSSGARRNDLSRLDLRRWASVTSARRRRRRWRGISGPWTRMLDAPVDTLQTVPEIGPVVAASVRDVRRGAAEPRAGRAAGRRRRQHGRARRRSRRTSPGRSRARCSC